MSTPYIVLSKLEQIEIELHTLHWWQSEPLKPEQYDFHSAFAMDTMTFSQWLQFIFIPRVRAAAAENKFPSQSQVAAQAIREFDGIPEASYLITLLSEFDALF
jgi:uncharacterized protein YqcC (DUF446 family)